jgi:protocatechuate 3,4-dioxygenase beta subunit
MSRQSDADHHAGLSQDLEVLQARIDRRRLLMWAAYLSATAVGCSGDSEGSAADAGPLSSGNQADDGTCTAVPNETEGPFPGDGTNGPNVLALSGIVRSDIRTSIAGATGVAAGVLLTVKLRVMDTSCTPLPGFAVYIWHCDRAGLYSMYSSGAEGENYLRGVQEADDDGVVTFTTIFPACYPGRWPHIHFELFESLGAIGDANDNVKTSQLAFPETICDDVFETEGYASSISNLAQLTLETDGIFRDGVTLQLASVTGNVESGYVATLDVAVPI